MEKLAEFLWGVPLLVLLTAVGLIFTVRTRFVQVRKLPAAIRQVGGSVKSTDRSAFRAMCTALAATVGTGNIAGVAGAISLGGPGAVFWMWVAAFLGMATKYAEAVLAMRYRTCDGRGGPMYYIRRGMGERFGWLASAFAFCAVLASFGMGNIAQINTISGAVVVALPQAPAFWISLSVGVAVATLVALVTLGGVERVGKVTEALVPIMAGGYIFSMAAVIVLHRRELGNVMEAIIRGAFCPEAVLGGGAGVGIRQAVRWGISRGVFSNEAGLGSAPIAHAASDKTPREQGLFGIFEVFFDTIVLCSLTAFAILSSSASVPYGAAAGAELATSALETVFGSWSAVILAVILSMLALATLISWQFYGLRCAEYLWGDGGARGYKVCYVAVVILGATMDLSKAWAVADLFNALMCLPNLIALFCLRNKVKADWKTG